MLVRSFFGIMGRTIRSTRPIEELGQRLPPRFSKFLNSLGSYNNSVETGSVPSRYALVGQATAAMEKRDPNFNTRADSDFVWHCDCDDQGNVRMQFVEYKVHAAFTHTCGYSRIRAIKGLIEGGQPDYRNRRCCTRCIDGRFPEPNCLSVGG